ncbi:MAG: hypothetical protein K0T00_2637, partial [Gaiellaceae bacterium]|nr:hypothetical protein [Gaiellaceae bacterium]
MPVSMSTTSFSRRRVATVMSFERASRVVASRWAETASRSTPKAAA